MRAVLLVARRIRHIRTRASSGFTLIELLVAMTIFAFMLAALYAGFFVAERAVRETEEGLVTLHEMRGAMDTLRREIEAAVPGDEAGEPGIVLRDRDVFGHPASQLTIITWGSPLEGSARAAYEVRAEGTGGAMSLMKTLAAPWAGEDSAREAAFVEGVEEFRVEASASSSGDEWLSTWGETDLPRRVRVTIAARVGERRVTLTETVAPMAGRTL
jgi:general secretion pathway protein J